MGDTHADVDTSDGISAESDRELRGHYGIGTGDQELRSDNKSYAAVVSEDAGAAERVENADELDTPDADRRTDESRERLHDPGSSEMRKVSAEDVTHNTQGDSADQESADGGRDDDARDDREGDDREGDDREADDREGDDRKADDRKDDKRTADERDEDQRTG